MTFGTDFASSKPIIGMVHLDALPGSPCAEDGLGRARERALADVSALESGGVDGLMIENYGDVPFHPDDVPKHTVAAMTRIAGEIAGETNLPLGVNVLRNDAEAAVAIAAAVGGSFVRINVHTGARVSDQGVLTGAAHTTMRLRESIDPSIEVYADLDVKHSSPLGEHSSPAERMGDHIDRGLADGIIVSGERTGAPVTPEYLQTIVDHRASLGFEQTPIILGSGVRSETIGELLQHADGAIVGTSIKHEGETTARVDEASVNELVAAADRVR